MPLRPFILSCLISLYFGCLFQIRNDKIVPKCYVLCHTATSSREGLLLLHSLAHSPVENLRLWLLFPQVQEDQASTVLCSGITSPKPQDYQQLWHTVPHHRGNGHDCHPDDETKLILLAFANHWNSQLLGQNYFQHHGGHSDMCQICTATLSWRWWLCALINLKCWMLHGLKSAGIPFPEPDQAG